MSSHLAHHARSTANAVGPPRERCWFCTDAVEFCTVSKKGAKVVYHVMSDKEVDEYLKKVEPAKEAAS